MTGQFVTSGEATFESPTHGAQDDWVLVIDDESKAFSAPGRGSTEAHK